MNCKKNKYHLSQTRARAREYQEHREVNDERHRWGLIMNRGKLVRLEQLVKLEKCVHLLLKCKSYFKNMNGEPEKST